MLSLTRTRQLEYFAKEFKIPEKEIIRFFEYYNRDFSEYNNSVYEKVETRISHWWNYLDHDWFSRRIDHYLDYLEKVSSNEANRVLLIDIGFSVPYLYARNDLSTKENIYSILIDKEQSAQLFYSAISSLNTTLQHSNLDEVVISDIEDTGKHSALLELLNKRIGEIKPTHILIVASELIEHLNDPNMFWKLITKIHHPPTTSFQTYITLPIGLPIPSHTISFSSKQEVEDYLKACLIIEEILLLKPSEDLTLNPYLTSCLCVFGTPKVIS